MARLTLDTNPKFKLLVHRLGLPRPYVRGLLETLWDVANACGEPVIGEADAVEAAAEWPGDPGVLFAALRDTRMIDPVDDDRWEIHDYWDHAPDYVRKRRAREQSRHEKGESLRADRSTADNGRQRRPLVNTRAPAPAHTLTPTSTALSLDLPVEATPARDNGVGEVWQAYLAARDDYHQATSGRSYGAPALTEKRRKLIKRRLKEYPPDDLVAAVRGIFQSPHNRGNNDRGEEFLGIEIALRVNQDRNNVERFRDLFRNGGPKPVAGSGPRTSTGGRWAYPDAAADFD